MKGIKKISLLLGIVIGALTLWGSFFVYQTVTDGFNLRQISSSLPENYFFETKGDCESIVYLFDQPLRYLGKGCQSYVFESFDKKYVVKFFKHKHLRELNWLKKLPLPTTWAEKKIKKRDERIRNIFASCQLAYEKLPQESGVVFVHLNRDPFIEKHVTLMNKLGFPQFIYLDEFQFVIQKKATPLAEMLKKTKDMNDIQVKIDQVCKLLEERMKRGITDKDPAVMRNMAFTENDSQPLFIDVGQFYLEEKTEEEIRQEIAHRLSEMALWADKHAPHILSAIHKKMDQVNAL